MFDVRREVRLQHVDHALCNAHLLRELIGWRGLDPDRHQWADQAITLLREAYQATLSAVADGHTALPADTLEFGEVACAV